MLQRTDLKQMAHLKRPAFLAVDFGSSGVRASVGRAFGKPLAVAREDIRYFHPALSPQTGREFDPEQAWKSTVRSIRRAVKTSGLKRSQIEAIGVSSQRLGLVLLDTDGKAISGIPNRDARAIFEAAEIDHACGDSIWAQTGHGPSLLLAWSKLLWLKKNEPEKFELCKAAVGIADWLAQRLTGVLTLNAALAVDCGLAAARTGEVAGHIAGSLGLGAVGLPRSLPSFAVQGALTGKAGTEIGLRAGTPVVNAGPDAQTGMFGLGAGDPGQTGMIAGWSAVVQQVTRSPVFDSARALWTGLHVIPDRWVVEGNAGDMGGAYSWIAGITAGRQRLARHVLMKELDREASTVPPGSMGAVAYLGPTFTPLSTIGLRPGGFVFPVPLAFEPPTRGSLVRAALENFSFALKYNTQKVADLAGGHGTIAIGGGMAAGPTFRKILSATLGTPAGFNTSGDATLRGTLSIAAVAVGAAEMRAALARRRSELSMVQPALSAVAEYQELYDSWRTREKQVLDIGL